MKPDAKSILASLSGISFSEQIQILTATMLYAAADVAGEDDQLYLFGLRKVISFVQLSAENVIHLHTKDKN